MASGAAGMQLIANATLPVSPWPNGAGRKADVAHGDGWSVSFAWLDADAPFSHLPGIDRTITLVEGAGFTLDIAGQSPLLGHAPFVPARFDGGATTTCTIRSPSRVLNLMTSRDRLRHSVQVVAVDGPQIFAVAGAVATLVVLLQGAVTVRQGTGILNLDRLDAIRITDTVEITGVMNTLVAAIQIS